MISIIIPSLNEEKYIGSLLASLMDQTYKDFEVIVVDGNSSDRTRDVVESFLPLLPRIKFVVEAKKGLGRARNVGAALSSGGTLIFTEADCLFEKDLLEVVLQKAEEKGLGCLNVLASPLSKRWFDHLYYKIFLDWALVIFQNFFPVITGYFIYVTREVFDQINGFNETITFEDSDFAQRAKKVTRFRILGKLGLYTSVRRLDSDGRFKCLLRGIVVTLYQFFVGNIKINSKVYAFGHHRKDGFHTKIIKRIGLGTAAVDRVPERKEEPLKEGRE